MSQKTHQKQLARARAKRQSARAEVKRSHRLVGAGIVVVVAVAAVVIGLTLQSGDTPDPAVAGDATTAPTDPPTAASDAPSAQPSGTASGTAAPQAVEPPPMIIDPSKDYTATITTEKGPIVIDLAADKAPVTVNNFVALATTGFYEGVVFHRIKEGFVIQGGDPTGTGRGGPGYTFEDELAYAEEVVTNNNALYPRGTVAMANSGPDTNGSQFFIVDAEPGYRFPPDYTIFGMVTEGLDTVDAIAAGEVTGPQQDLAADPVAMTSVTIEGPVDTKALGSWEPGRG